MINGNTQHNYGQHTEEKIAEVVEACRRYGDKSIIALAGVPGTGKSYIASIAAQRYTNEPTLVRSIQFHQSFSYEEFMEGMRIDEGGAVIVKDGVFLEWNTRAFDDPNLKYLLLIEELTRANLPSVLGELMTYIEHRDRPFLTVYSRRPMTVAQNLTILATYNPTDRSAIELDSALLRRLRIVWCPPSTGQLAEMLGGRNLNASVIEKLQAIFTTCQQQFPNDYEYLMPFGHGIFDSVHDERPDLNRLWEQRIRHLLKRPLVEPHPFTDVITECYPWRNPDYQEPQQQP